MPLEVGVSTSSGYSTFRAATVILTLCLFALFGFTSQMKRGKEIFFAVGDARDRNKMKVLVPLVVS